MDKISKQMDLPISGWNWLELCFRVRQDCAHATQIFSAVGLGPRTLQALSLAPARHEPYGSRVLFCSDDYEVKLLSWAVGATCAPHDHGLSDGIIWLAQGRFLETHYIFNGTLELSGSTVHNETNTVLSIDHNDIHSLLAADGGTSLHIHFPPVHDMQVYDYKNRRTVTVRDECGAWIPCDKNQILDESEWQTPPSKLNPGLEI